MYTYDYSLNGIQFLVQSDQVCNALDLIRPDDFPTAVKVNIEVKHNKVYYNELFEKKNQLVLTEVIATNEFSYSRGFTKVDGKECAILFSYLGYENHPHIILIFDINNYKIIAPKISDISDRYALRIIREYCLRNAENNGGMMLHAASASVDGKGILICGNSGDGKTTTLCSLLLHANANYISNDRTILNIKNDEIIASPFPLAMNLGIGTFQALQNKINLEYQNLKRKPDLTDKYEDIFQKDWNNEFIIEANWIRKDKIQLTTSEVEKAFDCKSSNSTPVKLMIFPKLSSGREKLKIYPIEYKEIKELIEKNIYTPNDPDFKNEWLGIRTVEEVSLIENVDNIIKHIKNLDLYRVECGIQYLNDSKEFLNEFLKNINLRRGINYEYF